MDDLSIFAGHPIAFLCRYVERRATAHLVILLAVLTAVACSVCTQYGVKFLVDTLTGGPAGRGQIWFAFALLVSLVAGDNLAWRLASWIASATFVGVTGDLRGDLFRYLTGHAPSYFTHRLPGALTGRVTATSNAVFTVENMFVWNVLPPCVATLGAIAFLFIVSQPMTLVMIAIAGTLIATLFRLAAAGAPLHNDFADKAAAVEGEITDVIGNISLIRSFGGLAREHRRFDETVGQEMTARRRSLRYLEKLRLLHAVVTVVLTIGLVTWAMLLWQHGAATTGNVVLVATLGFTILHATRDLAVALVDATQHMARLSEALNTLLIPHELRDHPEATHLDKRHGAIRFDGISFAYPGCAPVFEGFSLAIEPGERVGFVGESGGGKSTLFALLQRFHDLQGGRILIDEHDIARMKQESLRQAITVVPQDISLLHRSILDNIRYGRPDAADADVLAAAEAARCRDFIEALPEGAATMVGDRGLKLSGGQRQRVAIARAILRAAPILLLDEATSSLDSESEDAIRLALDNLMRGRTVVAIAHRLSTLRDFDRIVVLQSGRIAQSGPPADLMHRDGPYRDLIRREMNRLSREAA
jgi:ATP-binding cassette, subfamily B, bacterial